MYINELCYSILMILKFYINSPDLYEYHLPFKKTLHAKKMVCPAFKLITQSVKNNIYYILNIK